MTANKELHHVIIIGRILLEMALEMRIYGPWFIKEVLQGKSVREEEEQSGEKQDGEEERPSTVEPLQAELQPYSNPMERECKLHPLRLQALGREWAFRFCTSRSLTRSPLREPTFPGALAQSSKVNPWH